MKKCRKMLWIAALLSTLISLSLVDISFGAAASNKYDYVNELSGTQGGTTGVWFYEYLEKDNTADNGYKQNETGADLFSRYTYFGLSNTAWPNAKAWSTAWANEEAGLVTLYSDHGAIGANWCWAGFTRNDFNPVATFVAPQTGYVQLAMKIRAPQNMNSNGVQFKIVKYSVDNKPVTQVYPESGWHLMLPWNSGENPEYNEVTGVYASVSKNEKLCLIFDSNENSVGDEFAITEYTVTYVDPIAFDKPEYYAGYYTNAAYDSLNNISIPATLIGEVEGTVEYSSSDQSVIFPVDNYGNFTIHSKNVTYNGGTTPGYERQDPIVITAKLMQNGIVTAQATTNIYISENPISPDAESYTWSNKVQNLSNSPIWSYQSASSVTSLEDIKDVNYTPMSLGFVNYGAEGSNLGWYRYSGSGGNYRLDIVNNGLSTIADAALTFTAPKSGLIRIGGSDGDRLTKSTNGNGIGVAIRLQKGDTQTQLYPTDTLWQTVTRSSDSDTNFSYPDQYLEVNAGDKIYFVANALGNNASDVYWWQPVVTYVNTEHIESAIITEDNQVIVKYNLIPDFTNENVSVVSVLKDGNGQVVSAKIDTADMAEDVMSQFTFTYDIENPFQYIDLYFNTYILDSMENILPLKDSFTEKISRSPDPQKWQRTFNRNGFTDITYYSNAMGFNVNALVWVPDEYAENPQKRYPVMYYMHGRGGSCIEPFDTIFNSIKTAINNGDLDPMIIVGVNGGNNSWYMDTLDAYSKPRTAFLNELLPYIDHNYRTIASREGRMISGFSMGGYGSTSIAFEHYDKFSGVVTFGAAVYTTQEFISRWSGDFNQVFDKRTSILDNYTPYALLEKNTQAIKDSGLKLFMFVGNNDFTKEFNENLSRKLTEKEVAHELIIAGNAEHNMSQYNTLIGNQVVQKIADIFGQN